MDHCDTDGLVEQWKQKSSSGKYIRYNRKLQRRSLECEELMALRTVQSSNILSESGIGGNGNPQEMLQELAVKEEDERNEWD